MNGLAINGGEPVRVKKIPVTLPCLGEEEAKAAADAVRSTWVSGDGPKCEEFEEKFARYLGVRNALLVTSGTAALDVSVRALRFPAGSEVITPNYTYTSTALAPVLNNCRPVFCDVLEDYATADPDSLHSKITKNTRAIIPIDFAGHPCRIGELMQICRENGLKFIQDSCQALGAEYKEKKIGKFGDLTCFSFQATKNMTCGEGGAVVTNDDELAETIRVMREKGTNKHKILRGKQGGYQSFMDIGNSYVMGDVLAAILVEQLRKLDRMNEQRARHAKYLTKELKEIPGIRLMPVSPDVKSCWNFFCIRVPEGKRDFFAQALNSEGIGASPCYEALHLSPYYANNWGPFNDKDFKNSMQIPKELLRIPMFPQLARDELDDIIMGIEKVARYL